MSPAPPPAAGPATNLYCSRCLQTRRFRDLGPALECEACRKRLEKARPRGSVKR
jgi:hypothetical protein